MNSTFKVFNLENVLEYVDSEACDIEDELGEWLGKYKDRDNSTERHSASMRAYELYKLVHYFNLTIPLEVSIKIADLMTNRLFY